MNSNDHEHVHRCQTMKFCAHTRLNDFPLPTRHICVCGLQILEVLFVEGLILLLPDATALDSPRRSGSRGRLGTLFAHRGKQHRDVWNLLEDDHNKRAG